VAIIDSASCANGGLLPTAGGALGNFAYHVLPIGNVSLAQLSPNGVCGAAGCDTALLNVCSAGLGCSTSGLTAASKADLVAFVGSGHKLIVYDSECPGVDYSWLPHPFFTAPINTAATPPGTVSIVEENTLSSANPDNSHFIRTSILGGACSADQVQSDNALLSGDVAWCVDMSGSKGAASGPVHLYASYSDGGGHTGLILYNGLDLDASCGSPPGTLDACQNLSKIWLQELQQSLDPSCLPCQQPLPGCDDGNPCTDDTFNASGCVHTNNTAPCNDGNACTTGDVCHAGSCGGTPVTCSPLDQCHVAGTCDTSTGLCSNPAAPDGTPCDDGSTCTSPDTCHAGTCTGSPVPEICNGIDDNCNGVVDEGCFGKVTGGGEIAVPGGVASFGFVAESGPFGSSPKGQLEFQNHATGLNVHGTSIQTLSVNGNSATFTGTCVSKLGNVTSPCTFSVTVQDVAEPGKDVDGFSITVSSPAVQYGTAPITKGNIQVHVQ
jgi:hypothetical protein